MVIRRELITRCDSSGRYTEVDSYLLAGQPAMEVLSQMFYHAFPFLEHNGTMECFYMVREGYDISTTGQFITTPEGRIYYSAEYWMEALRTGERSLVTRIRILDSERDAPPSLTVHSHGTRDGLLVFTGIERAGKVRWEGPQLNAREPIRCSEAALFVWRQIKATVDAEPVLSCSP